jgi:aldose 1-epimerase
MSEDRTWRSEDELRLHHGTNSLTLLPARGGRAISLVADGLELLSREDDSDLGLGWYPMVPWQGRLTKNAITWAGDTYSMPITHEPWALHGLAYTRPWRVVDTSASSATLGLELGVDAGDPWPWPCEVKAGWHLEEGALVTTLELVSGGAEFPAELGWHPWFRRVLDRGGPVEVDLGPGRMLVRDADYRLSGELIAPPGGPYDDAFELVTGEVSLRWPGALELRCETDCGYAVVFDVPHDTVCVEPQTAPPDWINRAPSVVAPGRPRVARATWRWQRLQGPQGPS